MLLIAMTIALYATVIGLIITDRSRYTDYEIRRILRKDGLLAR